MKKILFTGGSGFVGRNFISKFNNKYSFINLGRSKNNLCENIEWNLKGKIPDSLDDYKFDTIIHCASVVGTDSKTSSSEYIDINVRSTAELLDYSVNSNIKQFIYISTGGVYGDSHGICSENSTCRPKGIYSISKYFSELLCQDYNNKLSVTILRPFFPYGPGQENRLISSLIEKILKKEKISLNASGTPNINPVYIHDFSNILDILVERQSDGIYNVCGDDKLSILDLCKIISNISNINDFKYEFNENTISDLIGSNEKIKGYTGYNLDFDIYRGLAETIFNTK